MAKYLITGGCGFIGTHLAHALTFAGHNVRIIDDLSTGKKIRAPKEAEIFIGCLTDRALLQKVLADVDGVFHLAAVVSVEKSFNEWASTHFVNVFGTIQLLELLSQMKKKIPLVYASSAAVYGAPKANPLDEGSVTSPLSPYGIDKLTCERHANIAHEIHHIPVMGFRLFNVYGPGQDGSSPYSGVISIFLEKIRKSEPISLFGDGTQTRDFIHVDDVVRFFLAAMKTPGANGEVFNICTGLEISLNELLYCFEAILEKKIKKNYLPARPGDIKTYVGKLNKAISYFGIKPQIPLFQGIKSLF